MKPKNTTENADQNRREPADLEKLQPRLTKAPSPDEIRERAYELHMEGGCVHGRDVDDWLQAERELMEE